MPHLHSITPSHYCEKSRWSLQLANIPFHETRYSPFFHIQPVRKAGGQRTTPVLETEEGVFSDSITISSWIQAQKKEFLPYGEGEELGRKILEAEEYFGRKIGPHTRRIAYYYLLPHKQLILDAMENPDTSEPADPWFSRLFPMFRFLMRKGMNITQAETKSSLEKLRERLDEIEERAEGQFIVGDSLTIADISFAALLAPMVIPEKYGAKMPSLTDLDVDLQALIQECRAHPAGQRCLWLYENYR